MSTKASPLAALGDAMASLDDPRLREIGEALRNVDRFAHAPDASAGEAAMVMKRLRDATRDAAADATPEIAVHLDVAWLTEHGVSTVLAGDPKAIDALLAEIRAEQDERANTLEADDPDDPLAGSLGAEPASFFRRYVEIVTDPSPSMEDALILCAAMLRFAIEHGLQRTGNSVARTVEANARRSRGDTAGSEADDSELVEILRDVTRGGKPEDRDELRDRIADAEYTCGAPDVCRIWIDGDRFHASWNDGRTRSWALDHVGDMALKKQLIARERIRG